MSSSVRPRLGLVKGPAQAEPPPRRDSIPFPTWHALCAEMLSRHREMGLSYGECCLFAVLVHYSTPDECGVRFSHATNATLAEKMGCEERDVRRFLKALEAGEFIARCKRTDRGKTRELDRSRESIMILWGPGSDQVAPWSYPWADQSPEAVAAARARIAEAGGRPSPAPTVKIDHAERPARSNLTMGTVNSDHGCTVNSDHALGQICPTYEIPPESPRENPYDAPSSSPTPPRPGAESKPPTAGEDAGEAIGLPADWNVMLPPAAAGQALRGMVARAERERRPAERTTPEQNSAGLEWLARWRKWRDGGRLGPIPAWTSAAPMLPSVRAKFDEVAPPAEASG